MDSQQSSPALLQSSLKEVEEKLRVLQAERRFLEEKLKAVKGEERQTEKEGLDLADKVSLLMKKEVTLVQERDNLRGKLKQNIKQTRQLEDLDKK